MPLLQSELNINLVVARTVNFTVKCNDTWPPFKIVMKRNGQPMSLTGVQVLMQIKEKQEDNEAVMELSTESGSLSIGGADNNEVIFNNPRITLRPGSYFYDVQFMFAEDSIVTYYKGKIAAEGDVSR